MFFTDGINTDKTEYRAGESRESEPFYSDARYSPADDSTAPPRYYVPPQRNVSDPFVEAPEKKEKPAKTRKGAGPALIAALCLLFSAAGGAAGALYVEKKDAARFEELETKVASLDATLLEGIMRPYPEDDGTPGEPVPAEPSEVTVSPSGIYDAACAQVVGVTTEVTYSNFFGQTSSSAVSGSGFVVADGGYILTNYHVIEYAYKYNYTVTVFLYDGTAYDAEITGVDEDNDLAVLKIDAPGLAPVKFADSDSISVGDLAYAVGNPLGELEFTMTSGTVSALDRLIAAEKKGASINMFQIDAAVNSGNSGGPVYNSRGEVIGVVTAKYKSEGVEGIGFAIPSNDASKIAQDIISNGYVTGKAYLGVYYDESSNSIYNMYYSDLWNTPEGVMVLQVENGSCAARAGICDYDTIVSIDDYAIADCSDLRNALRQYSAGDSAVVTVYRAGGVIAAGEYIDMHIVFDEAVPKSYSMNMSAA